MIPLFYHWPPAAAPTNMAAMLAAMATVGATLRVAGEQAQIRMGQGLAGTAVIQASCAADEPTVQYFAPMAFDTFPNSAMTVRARLRNVPASCTQASINQPCASSDPDCEHALQESISSSLPATNPTKSLTAVGLLAILTDPALFYCRWRGPDGAATLGPLRAIISAEEHAGHLLALAVDVFCPPPSWADFQGNVSAGAHVAERGLRVQLEVLHLDASTPSQALDLLAYSGPQGGNDIYFAVPVAPPAPPPASDFDGSVLMPASETVDGYQAGYWKSPMGDGGSATSRLRLTASCPNPRITYHQHGGSDASLNGMYYVTDAAGTVLASTHPNPDLCNQDGCTASGDCWCPDTRFDLTLNAGVYCTHRPLPQLLCWTARVKSLRAPSSGLCATLRPSRVPQQPDGRHVRPICVSRYHSAHSRHRNI